jgi:hypothetical protein
MLSDAGQRSADGIWPPRDLVLAGQGTRGEVLRPGAGRATDGCMIFVALLVYCVLGLLTDALVRLLERKALGWRRSFVEA